MTTAEAYREGLAYGRRIAVYEGSPPPPSAPRYEDSLRFEIALHTWKGNHLRRARALGELRGYRQAQP